MSGIRRPYKRTLGEGFLSNPLEALFEQLGRGEILGMPWGCPTRFLTPEPDFTGIPGRSFPKPETLNPKP